MNNKQQWLPIVASIGIGAAAYYSMTKGKGIGKTVKQMMPLVTGLTAGGPNSQF